MASMITPNEQPDYLPLVTELGSHTHSTSLLHSAPSESGASATPHLGSLSELGGRAGNGTLSLTHVLSGFQEEGSLVQALHEQPHGKHGVMTPVPGRGGGGGADYPRHLEADHLGPCTTDFDPTSLLMPPSPPTMECIMTWLL